MTSEQDNLDLPQALVVPPRRARFSPIWIVPIVAALVALGIAIDRYVSEDLSVDHDLLRRHLASVVYTMKTFVQMRFGS